MVEGSVARQPAALAPAGTDPWRNVRLCCLHNDEGSEVTLLFWCGCKYIRMFIGDEWHECKGHSGAAKEGTFNLIYPATD